MLCFKISSDARFFAILHPTLQEIVLDLTNGIWKEKTGEEDLVLSELWRDHDDTVASYRAAGLDPPKISVHELLPCRGADVSVRRRLDGAYLPDAQVKEVVEELNQRWQYHLTDRYQVALFHDVRGPHIHLQVRPGTETKRR